MLVLTMVALMLVLVLQGLPLVFVMGAISVVYMFAADINIAILGQRMVSRLDSFLILAIPLFYLAGELMNACRLTDRIVAMARVFVGHIHGGLAQVNIFSSMIFAGMSGSATADTAALGSVLIPAMKKEGYRADFAAAVTVASAVVGPIIPPSVAMVIYGALTDVSIGRLLLAGVFPGLVIIAAQMIFTYFLAKRHGYHKYPLASFKEVTKATYHGFPALLFPLIIVGGIASGQFTPTEAAGIAVLYGVVLGLIVYRNVGIWDLWKTIEKVMLASTRILIIVAAASAFSWVMVNEKVPQTIATFLSTVTDNPLAVLTIMIVFLFVVGLIMVASSAEIVLAPILVPVVVQFGIDPVHFGVIMVFVLIIGGATPPVGVLLFVAQDIAEISFAQMVRAMLPYYIPLVGAVVILALFPQISLWLPNLVFGSP